MTRDIPSEDVGTEEGGTRDIRVTAAAAAAVGGAPATTEGDRVTGCRGSRGSSKYRDGKWFSTHLQ